MTVLDSAFHSLRLYIPSSSNIPSWATVPNSSFSELDLAVNKDSSLQLHLLVHAVGRDPRLPEADV